MKLKKAAENELLNVLHSTVTSSSVFPFVPVSIFFDIAVDLKKVNGMCVVISKN